MTEVQLDRTLSPRFATPATDARVTRTAAALEANGSTVAQKIVPDLEDALRPIEEYVFPLEDSRAQAAYGVHSGLNKVLIVNREWTPDRTTVVLCDEALGFSR